MTTQRGIAILLGIFLIGACAVGLSLWDNKVIKSAVTTPGPIFKAAAPNGNGVPDRDDNSRPTFKTKSDRLTAEMDLAYCWFATFTNETTGLSHTLHNAYDEAGKPCH